jgi:uncharacterized integral membrane protein
MAMKNLQFYDNWREILKRAWSLRLMALAAVLSGVEVALPFFQESFPRGVFALLSAAAVAGAFVARLVAQKDI